MAWVRYMHVSLSCSAPGDVRTVLTQETRKYFGSLLRLTWQGESLCDIAGLASYTRRAALDEAGRLRAGLLSTISELVEHRHGGR